MKPSEFPALGRLALEHLESIVRIDSASDEQSESVPTTPGQTELADYLAGFFSTLGAEVERDTFANIIATFPGVGRGAQQAPIAMMVHLDTAPGTVAVDGLQVIPGWQGERISYPANPTLDVSVATYPVIEEYVGQDLVHGPGDAPFGLDDKLGLTHMMTLARLITADPDTERPPLLLIGRPDEEVGREAAILGLAKTLAARGVDFGYTIDGLLPFEINVENFNAAGGSLHFIERPLDGATAYGIDVIIGGVNTHGATAKAEGHRPATRFAAEIMAHLEANGWTAQHIAPTRFSCIIERDCDGTISFNVADSEAAYALKSAVAAVIDPHLPRGASYRFEEAEPRAPSGAVWDAISYVRRFLASDGIHPIAAEDSEGREGYSQPYRIVPTLGGARLDVRLRDFDPDGLEARKAHVHAIAPEGVRVELADQYVNMAPRLAHRPELAEWPQYAAARIGVEARTLPIRGGTGVDPFLNAGVPVANLGTGYFAPESEKEFTGLQLMADHARWLHALLGIIVEARA